MEGKKEWDNIGWKRSSIRKKKAVLSVSSCNLLSRDMIKQINVYSNTHGLTCIFKSIISK